MSDHAYWRIWIDTTEGGSAGVGVIEIEMYAAGSTTNLAVGGTATAINNYAGWEPSNAFNGSTVGNGWATSGGSAPFWIQYQFTSPVSIESFSWLARSSPNHVDSPATGRLAYSDDGVTWTDSFSFVEAPWSSSETRTITAPQILLAEGFGHFTLSTDTTDVNNQLASRGLPSHASPDIVTDSDGRLAVQIRGTSRADVSYGLEGLACTHIHVRLSLIGEAWIDPYTSGLTSGLRWQASGDVVVPALNGWTAETISTGIAESEIRVIEYVLRDGSFHIYLNGVEIYSSTTTLTEFPRLKMRGTSNTTSRGVIYKDIVFTERAYKFDAPVKVLPLLEDTVSTTGSLTVATTTKEAMQSITDDTSYVDLTAGQVLASDFSPIPTDINPNLVGLVLTARASSGDSTPITASTDTGGGFVTAFNIASAGSVTAHRGVALLNPDTSSAYTVSEINALDFKITG